MKLSSWLAARERSWNGVFSSGWRKCGSLSVSISGSLRQPPPRGVAPGEPHHPAARMAAGTTQEKARERCLILRRARYRPRHEELIERQLRVVPVPADDAELALDIARQQQLRRTHAV